MDVLSLVATTLNKHGGVIYGQVWDDIPLFWWLRRHDGVKPVEGGLNIVENIEVAKNSTVDWRDPKASIPLVEQDPIRQVAWTWKTIDGSVPIFVDDERKNRGEARVVDLAEALIDNLRNTMTERIGKALYNNANTNPLSLDGLETICSASNVYPAPDDRAQVPGIDRSVSANAFWRAIVMDTAQTWKLNQGNESWLHGYMMVTRGSSIEQPNIILCSPELWEAYDSMLMASQRFENPELAEAGFRNLMYKNCAVIADFNITAGTTYILNTKYLHLRPDSMCAEKFIVRDRHPMEDQLADRVLVAWVGNITCTVPNRQCKISNKTVPS